MSKFNILSATGMLGSGFQEDSVRKAVARGIDAIGCDAGSTDAGPGALATGEPQFSRAAIKRDLDVVLRHAREPRLPVIIGSCGTAGGDANLAHVRDVVIELARESNRRMRVAMIHAEVDANTTRSLLRSGRIRGAGTDAPLTEDDIDASLHTVAMMGAEPIQQAVETGADVVLAGRCSDAALFAALPLSRGLEAAACWHTGKILECGAAAVAVRVAPDSMLGEIRSDGSFEISPLRDDYRCTPQSIASHTLYENSDPFRLVEPGGILDTGESRYEAVDDRTVRVSGSRFLPVDEYTVKLEGARLAGYSTIVLGAVRDPLILRQLDPWLEQLDGALRTRLVNTVGADADFTIVTRVYGRNGVMGDLEPNGANFEGHEAAILWDVLSPDQTLSHSIASSLSHMAVHNPIQEWHGLISGVAFPFAPAEVDRGPAYEFHINHVATLQDPMELFDIELIEV